MPWITVKSQSQRQWLFKAKRGKSFALCSSLACQAGGGIHILVGTADNGWDNAGCKQAEHWAGPCPEPCTGNSKGNSSFREGQTPHRHRVPKAGEPEQTCLVCPCAKHHPHVRGSTGCWEPSLAWESLDVPSRCWAGASAGVG